ncbi:MAG: S8 family serine peptidase [Eubacteriales bacterium]
MRLKKILLFTAAFFFVVAVTVAGYTCFQVPGQAQLLNDRSREIIGADLLNAPGFIAPAGLTGKGQVVAVADSGVDRGSLEDIHPDLASQPGKKPRIIMLKSWSGRPVADDPVGHGTHMVGTIAGNGASSGGKFKGVAPDASIYFQGILDEKGKVAPPADVEKLFLPAYQAGARIHVNAWGSGTGAYSGNAMKADAFMRKYPDFLVIFGAGNSGPGARSLTSEANSKNALVVGSSVSPRPALDFSSEGTLETAEFSSRGPATDGRIKPDLLAPGTSIISARSALVKENLPGFPMYTSMQGSSMASAVAAGSSALIREYIQKEMAIPQPAAASLKAALINGSRTPDTGPSRESFGVLDLVGTVLALKEKTMHLTEEIWGLPEGGTKTYSIKVSDSATPFKATLAWTDPAGDPLSKNALVNNLDLLVTAPNGQTYAGNSFVGQTPDVSNNVEQVFIKNPIPGEYLVQVRAASVAVSAVRNTSVNMQDYSLVYGQPLSTGIVREYAPGSFIELYGGNRVNPSGKEMHYIFNDNTSNSIQIEPGYRVYFNSGSVYVVGRLWSQESVQFREGMGGRVWFEADRDNREGGYYQSREAPSGVMVNGSYRANLSGLPPGIGIKANLDGLTQTLWQVVIGYSTVKGSVDRIVQEEIGNIDSMYLFRDDRVYHVSPGATYIYNDTFEGADPVETVFGPGRLDGLGKIMPGQQVTLVLSPVSGMVNSIVVNRSIVSGYVSGVVPGENKITIGKNPAFHVFTGAGVQKDREASSLNNITPGDYVVAVILPGTREILGMADYSSVAYGQILFTSNNEKTVYMNDNKNRFQMYRLTPDTEVRRWGLIADASTLTSGTWVRAILSPDNKEILYLDVAELLEDQQEELASVDGLHIDTASGERYRVSHDFTTVTKDGLPVTIEDLRPGEKAIMVSLLAPAPYKKVLVAVRARGPEGGHRPDLIAVVREEKGLLALSGYTSGQLYIWHENGMREEIPIRGDGGSFKTILRFVENEEVVKLVSVNSSSGAVSGKTFTRSEVVSRRYDDISGHWAERAIVATVFSGIMVGNGDGTFKPDLPVSRSVLSIVLTGLVVAGGEAIGEEAFRDTALPGQGVTRASFMVLLKESVYDPGKVPYGYKTPFIDCEEVTEEEKEAIAWGYYRGIIKGRSAQVFDPRSPLTRAEVATIIQRVLQGQS